MKRVYKFATGEEIPEGAVYLKTVVQTQVIKDTSYFSGGTIKRRHILDDCYFVWHYFLVEIK